MKKNVRNCVIESLDNSLIGGILLGLSVENGEISFQREFFPCCQGEGGYFNEKEGHARICPLKGRVKRVREVLKKYYTVWGDRFPESPHYTLPRRSAEIIGNIEKVIRGDAPLACVSAGKKDAPSDLWKFALASIWRFGLDVHMVSFKKYSSKNLLPDIKKLNGVERIAIFAEHVDRLWEPSVVNEFESLLSFAYNSGSFLWVEFITETCGRTDPERKEFESATEELRHRVNVIKQKSPLRFLEPSALSRLKSLCCQTR
ncbi:MAG: hypothetical protein HQK54_12480 [Oligoflexales bacterium]|nr:hypothetical protein [Oligoflexales bacterium]